MSPSITTPIEDSCPRCLKTQDLCVCQGIRRLKTQRNILILQHPQEPDKELGTAKLAELALEKAKLKVGLSWPNLKKAWGSEDALNSQWAVLYLGSGIKEQDKTAFAKKPGSLKWVDKKSKAFLDQESTSKEIQGIIVLDGTWSQAKALWWRNPWLLKLKRAILIPKGPSLYRELRREPRRECLSTLEALGQSLTALGEDPKVEAQLLEVFKSLLEKYRDRKKPGSGSKPKPPAPQAEPA